jgi:hypothetical protein
MSNALGWKAKAISCITAVFVVLGVLEVIVIPLFWAVWRIM